MNQKYNHKLFNSLSDNQKQDVYEKINELSNQIDNELVTAFRGKEEFPVPAKLFPGRVQSIWRYYSMFGFIREQHEKYLFDMRETVSYAISFMYRITEICGHTCYDCEPEFTDSEEYGFSQTEWNAFIEWIDGFYISDYGFPKLNELQCELWSSNHLEHILITIDRIMNVYHGSGPLADRFIIGGITPLNELAFSTE